MKSALILASMALAFGGSTAMAVDPAVSTTEVSDNTTSEVVSSEAVSSETPKEGLSVSSETPEPEQEPETFESQVTSSVYWIQDGETIQDGSNKYGDVYLSAEEGHEGDEVTVIVSGNPTIDISGKMISLYKYALSYVTFNGQKIEATDSEKGEYRVTLVKGSNSIQAYFSGRVELSGMDISNVNWKSLLTVDNLLKFLYFVITLFLSSGFFITLIRSKKQKIKTTDEITSIVTDAVQKVTSEKTQDFLTNTVKPMISTQNEQLADAADTSRVLMRVALLSQENTPEARAQIVKELQNYKTSDKELADKVQAIVNDAIKKQKDDEKAKADSVQAVKDSVNSIEPMKTDKDDTPDAGGEYGTL